MGLLTALLVVVTLAPARPSDLARAELAGPVRSVLVRVATLSGDGKEGPPRPGRNDDYDERGDLEDSQVYSDWMVSLRRTRSYDASGNRLDRLYETPAPNRPPPAVPPPGAAAPPPAVTAEDGAKLHLTVPRFDASGRIVEELLYAGAAPSERALTARIAFGYDAKGRVAEQVNFTAAGKRSTKRVYVRDESGDVVEERHHGEDDSAPIVTKYRYEKRDANGNWTVRTSTTTYPGGGGAPRVVAQREYRTILYHEVGVGDLKVHTKPRFHNTPRPEYPRACSEQDVTGSVVVKALLAADGTVAWAEVTTGLPCGLNEKAAEAVYKLKFTPATNAAGKPVDCWMNVTVVFSRSR
jgi:TonB family protein